MALPMSWTSPCTVPTMTVPFFSPSPPTRAALQTLVAASMAWAASISSGRKTSPRLEGVADLADAHDEALVDDLAGGHAGGQGARGDVLGGGGVEVDDRVDRLLDELVFVGRHLRSLLATSCLARSTAAAAFGP